MRWLADAPAHGLSQKAVRTEGKQAPFNFVLPYNQAQIQPNARILLSAAITVNGQLMFITDTVQTVINQGGNRADLVLVPRGAIPITTSGKIRRSACVDRYRLDEFSRLDVTT